MGRRRQAAEFDRGAVAAQRINPRRLLLGEDAFEPIEIGQARVVIIGVADPVDRLAGLVGGELEGPRPFDVLLVPAWVLCKGTFFVDENYAGPRAPAKTQLSRI